MKTEAGVHPFLGVHNLNFKSIIYIPDLVSIFVQLGSSLRDQKPKVMYDHWLSHFKQNYYPRLT